MRVIPKARMSHTLHPQEKFEGSRSREFPGVRAGERTAYLADTNRTGRRRFAAPGGSYDRVLRFLSVTLPILIALIAAVLIVAPLTYRKDVSLILDRHKVATTNQRIALSHAVYTGRDDQGRIFSVAAREAVQPSSREPVVKLSDLSAAVQLADGKAIIMAPGGTYDFGSAKVNVPCLVNVRAPDGYWLVTSGVDIDLRARRLEAVRGVRGAVPTGSFSADRMTVDLDARTITLEGRVRLRMTPGNLRLPK